ncbi:MAG: hypothetical protein AAB438_04030 [Patescibacteria group bacterium]
MDASNINLDTTQLSQPAFVNLDYVFYKIYAFFHNIGGYFSDSETGSGVDVRLGDAANSPVVNSDWSLNLFKFFLYFLLLFFITVICYCAVRMLEIRKKEHEHLHHEIHEYAHKQKEKEAKAEKGIESVSKNPRWVSVLKSLSSENEADWKVAVIDADEMLADLMDELGFKGENLGEKLKLADRDKFHSLSAAWEVHTVRNRIAHEGSAFTLTTREAKRVIALYEQIFREFGYI